MEKKIVNLWGDPIVSLNGTRFPVSALATPQPGPGKTFTVIDPVRMGLGVTGFEMIKTEGLIKDMMREFTTATYRLWEERLKAYLQENLERIGVNFENDIEFLRICKEQIRRVSYQDKPNYYEFYYEKFGEKILLGSYSDKIETINEGSKITMIIGKEFKAQSTERPTEGWDEADY